MIEVCIEAFNKVLGGKHQVRNLVLLMICGLFTFAVYERYTSYFQFSRLEKATSLLERLHDVGPKVASDENLSAIHSSLVHSLEDIVGTNTTSLQNHSNFLRFLGGFWIWFAISLMLIPSCKDKSDATAILGCWAFGLLFALFAMILPEGNWPWLHYILYPILSLVVFIVFVIVITCKNSRKVKNSEPEAEQPTGYPE